MDELLAKATQGVQPGDPGAFGTIFVNLMALVPWGELILWQVVFVLVGGALGWWRGRFVAGVVASLVLGPFGWVVPFMPARTPARASAPVRHGRPSTMPPPLPPSVRQPPPLSTLSSKKR